MCTTVYTAACMVICMLVGISVCVCMYDCVYACMYACMFACICFFDRIVTTKQQPMIGKLINNNKF